MRSNRLSKRFSRSVKRWSIAVNRLSKRFSRCVSRWSTLLIRSLIVVTVKNDVDLSKGKDSYYQGRYGYQKGFLVHGLFLLVPPLWLLSLQKIKFSNAARIPTITQARTITPHIPPSGFCCDCLTCFVGRSCCC